MQFEKQFDIIDKDFNDEYLVTLKDSEYATAARWKNGTWYDSKDNIIDPDIFTASSYEIYKNAYDAFMALVSDDEATAAQLRTVLQERWQNTRQSSY